MTGHFEQELQRHKLYVHVEENCVLSPLLDENEIMCFSDSSCCVALSPRASICVRFQYGLCFVLSHIITAPYPLTSNPVLPVLME